MFWLDLNSFCPQILKDLLLLLENFPLTTDTKEGGQHQNVFQIFSHVMWLSCIKVKNYPALMFCFFSQIAKKCNMKTQLQQWTVLF